MADTATMEQLMGSVEISASFYDPISKQWAHTQRLTADNFLDRSPLIAGQSASDALIVWLSNEHNDLSGDAIKPNKLWAAKWNGTSWSAPQSVASLPYGAVKYNFTYSGGKGEVVLSLDTDNDQSTDEDHELFGIKYQNGVWGSLAKLTDLDSILFLRDPFPVINGSNLLNQGTDRNTRIIVFVSNLQLAQGESSPSVIVILIGSNNQSYDIAAEDVQAVPNFNLTQITFRLPNNLPVGTYTIKVKARGQTSNSGTIRIRN